MIFVVLLIYLVISEYPTDIQPPLFDTNEPWLEVCVCVCVCVCIGAKANQLISVPIRTRLFPLLDCYCAYYWWISIGDAPELSFLISTRLQIPPIVSKQWKTLLSILLGEGAGEEEGEGVCPSASLPPTLIFQLRYIKWSAGEQSRHVSI